MDYAIEFVKHVPPFAWVALIAVGWRAWRYARPHVGRADRLWLRPGFIGLFSLVGVVIAVERVGSVPLLIAVWLVAFALGGAVGWATLARAQIGADHATGRITVPADYSFPPLLLLFFALRFYVGWRLASDPAAATHLSFAIGQTAASAFIVGIFAGKAWALWRKWKGSAREMALPEPGAAL